jgi:TldD protein
MSAPIWDEVAELALKRVIASGAEYGDIRLLDSTNQTISGEDRRIASIRESQDRGFGIRVLYHGAWGFAASSVLSLEESIGSLASCGVARASGPVRTANSLFRPKGHVWSSTSWP